MCPVGVATSRSSSVKPAIAPRLWLLLVGVNEYQDEELPGLRYSAVDCQVLAEALTGATGGQFSQTEVKVYHDFAPELPLLADVRASLAQFAAAAQPLDTILVYFSGHGMLQENTQQAFLCLADTQKNNLENTGLAVQELLQLLGSSKAQNQLVWLDACHSGGMTLRGMNPTPRLVEVLQQRAAKSQGFYALLSCDTNQQSWEFPELGHGVFTYYLMRGLKGDAADSQGVISADGLYKYVYHQTLQYIDKTNQQLRLINQQKRGKGETQLFSEYPLQTPKRIVEGIGEVILGAVGAIAPSISPRTALVIEGISGSQAALNFSKVLGGVGVFELEYLPRSGKITAEDIRENIQKCLHYTGRSLQFNHEEKATSLLYLRGRLAETPAGDAALVLWDEICLSRAWLKQQLRRSPVTQQIIILDCFLDVNSHTSLQDWVEDLQVGSEKGQCIIAAISPQDNSELFAQALRETLQGASVSSGLSVAAWITQLQVYLAAQSLSFKTWLSGRQGIIEIIPATTGAQARKKAVLDLKICPYRGLKAFAEEDAQYFYGRESLTQQLISQVAHKSFLAVVGASGSGKSSVVQAGLIAQLRSGKQLVGSESWLIKCLRPGGSPLEVLARKLGETNRQERQERQEREVLESYSVSSPFVLEGMLYEGVEGFVYWLRGRTEPMVVLVIDQFEELFTLAGSEERQRFLELVLGAVEYAADKFKLVITVRADFIAACLEVPGLARLLQQSSVLVPPKLSDEDYRRVIVNPAEQVGLKVEPGLVEVLLQELNHTSGDLPLLEFVLEQLWEFRQAGELTLAAYQQQIGGIKGALERKAQEVYEGLDNQAQDCARWIFLSLTQLGEGTEDTRRRVSKSELVVQKYPDELVERTLLALTAAKLVVVNLDDELGSARGEEALTYISPVVTIEVAHEILIRHWSTLRWWLEENRSRLRLTRQIEQAAALWKHHHEQADFLLQGVRLGEAEEIYVKYTDELSVDVQHFIAACLTAREQQQLEQKKRLRQAQTAVAAISVLGIAASGFGGFAYFQKQAAQLREVAALNASAAALLLSHQQLESVIASVRATREVKQVWFSGKDLQMATAATLQQSLSQTQEVNRLQSHSQQVNAVSFSRDGKMIASVSDDTTIKLWDGAGKLYQTINNNSKRVNAIAYSPNNKFFAAAVADNTIQLYNVNGDLIHAFTGHGDIVTDVNFSPDGKMLVSASMDNTIKLWRIDGTVIKSWNAHDGWVNTVAFSPDGKIIASGGEDNLVKLWQISDGKLIKSLPGHAGRITRVRFNIDGKVIASASGDGFIKVWNIGGKLLQNISAHDGQVNSIQFRPDNQVLVSAGADGNIKFWGMDGDLLGSISGNGEQVRDVSFSPNGEVIASAGADKSVRLWRVNHQSTDDVLRVSFGAGGKVLAAVDLDGKVSVWRGDRNESNRKGRKGREEKRGMRGLESDYGSASREKLITKFSEVADIVGFSDDGKLLAIVTPQKSVKVWDVQEERLLSVLSGHEDRVTSVSFSGDGKVMASGSADKTIKLWRVVDGKLLKTLAGHEDEVTSLSFSDDGKLLASGGVDNTVKLWQSDGKLIQNFTGHGLAIASLSFTPDGKTLASASWDNTIKLWRVADGNLIHTLVAHTDGVTSLSFTPDNQILASGSADKTIKLWNVVDGKLLKTLFGSSGKVNSITFTGDGKELLSSAENAGVMSWNLDLADLMQQGCARIANYLQNNRNVSQSDRSICN